MGRLPMELVRAAPAGPSEVAGLVRSVPGRREDAATGAGATGAGVGENSAGAYAGAVSGAGLPVLQESIVAGSGVCSGCGAVQAAEVSEDWSDADPTGFQIDGSGTLPPPPSPTPVAWPSMAWKDGVADAMPAATAAG